METIGVGSAGRWSRFSEENVVESEVGVLQRVLVHRPGRELDWVVPDDLGELLFDEVPWLEAVQSEHDQFTAVMREHGVEVCYLGQLLAEALVDPVTRYELTRAAVDRAVLGEALYDAVVDHLDGLSSGELAERLIAGVALGEIAQLPRTLVTCSGPDLAFVVNPLPNQQFVRDSGSWIGRGVSVNRLAKPARVREAHQVKAVLRLLGGRVLWPGGSPPAPLEGGDVLVVGQGCVVVGVGERTVAAAVEALAAQLYDQQIAHTVIAVLLPKGRPTMHLDTVMTMVDWDTFLVSPLHLRQCQAFRLIPRGGGVRAVAVDDLFREIARALGVAGVRVIPIGGDSCAQRREQWSDAANVLAMRPGVVIAYDRNVHTNELLSHFGITVLPVASAELSRGRGGPHCLSCPWWRGDNDKVL